MKYLIFIGVVLAECLLLLVLFSYGARKSSLLDADRNSRRLIVKTLKLTDLSIWTEARYTRHPSQADLFSPFQDFPSSLEHFPAGSIIAPHQKEDMY